MNEISRFVSRVANAARVSSSQPPENVVRAAVVRKLFLVDYALCGALQNIPSVPELAFFVESVSNRCRCTTRGMRWLFNEARRIKMDAGSFRPLTPADVIRTDQKYTNWGEIGINRDSWKAALPAPEDTELMQIPEVKNYLDHLQKQLQNK